MVYSTLYANGARLKDIPAEVRIVSRESTGKATAAQVGLNIVMLALGGLSVKTFSKDDLTGDEIAGVADRSHLRNPVATDFVQTLQRAVDVHMQEQGVWAGRTFSKPLVVGGGNVKLVYANLAGQEAPNYQLLLDLQVYKSPEERSIWSASPVVDCHARSEPAQALSWWADNSYSQVQQQLEQMLQTCERKVVEQLPKLLEK